MTDAARGGFHHIALKCADLEACEHFYVGVLGLRVLRRWPGADDKDRSVWLAVGEDGAFLALERATEGQVPPVDFRDGRAGQHLFALRITRSERSAWEKRFLEADIPVVHRTRWTLYVRDPEGNRIGFSHHPDDA